MRLLCWSHHSTSEYKKGPSRLSPGPHSHPAMFKLARRISPESREIAFVQRRAIRGSRPVVNDGSDERSGARFSAPCEKPKLGPCLAPPVGLVAAASQECSSVGRASVSKTEGPRFESVHSCHFSRHRWIGDTAFAVNACACLFLPLQGVAGGGASPAVMAVEPRRPRPPPPSGLRPAPPYRGGISIS